MKNLTIYVTCVILSLLLFSCEPEELPLDSELRINPDLEISLETGEQKDLPPSKDGKD